MGKKEKLIFCMCMLRFPIRFKRMGMDIRNSVNDMGMGEKQNTGNITCEQDKQKPFFRNMSVAFSHIRAKIHFFNLFDKYYIEYF